MRRPSHPQRQAFRAAIAWTLPGAEACAIVTLGVRPVSVATADGYICPTAGETAVKPIAAFVEKPAAEAAAALVAAGALWNSGTFVASTATLVAEIARLAPEVAAVEHAFYSTGFSAHIRDVITSRHHERQSIIITYAD